MDLTLSRTKCSIPRILLLAFLVSLPRSKAVVFYSTGDAEFNTAAPGGTLADSGWDLQGYWNLFLGTPVSSNYFITARHVGGTMDWAFLLQENSYTPLARFTHPTADLALWRVSGVFTNFAPLYINSNEVGRSLVVFGRGRQRGAEINLNNQIKGWRWGNPDYRLRWGENRVAAITNGRGEPVTSTDQVQCLSATFDAGAGRNEAHLSVGDSGGAVFIQEDGVWKLAGINSTVSGYYNTNQVGKGFEATLFDERGFYRGSENDWEYQSGDEIQPGAFYAIRISAYVRWIQNVVTYGNPKGEMRVEESNSPQGPFRTAAAEINGETQTVRLPAPISPRFYRLRATDAARISSITNSAGTIVLTFE